MDTQRKYIRALALDLGMDFSADGLNLNLNLNLNVDGSDSFGGDIEVFAVNGKHYTPWHFDGQENFTIQLKGTKKWKISKQQVNHPVTNLHPAAANRETVNHDLKMHATYFSGKLSQPTDERDRDGYILNEEERECETFLLRPGSILYAPAGMWHTVESEDEGGSLSINFAVTGSRWCELIINRLTSALWGDELMRSMIHVGNTHEDTLVTANKVVSSLQSMINSLKGEHFISRNLYTDTKLDTLIVCSHSCKDKDEDIVWATREAASEITITETTKVRINPLMVLIKDEAVSNNTNNFSAARRDTKGAKDGGEAGYTLVSYQLHSGFGSNSSFASSYGCTIKVCLFPYFFFPSFLCALTV